jgi:hypothetical protein
MPHASLRCVVCLGVVSFGIPGAIPPSLPGSRWVDMAARKTTRSSPHQDTFYQTVAGAVREGLKKLRSRNDIPYDGVVGEPDEWIPENFRQEFRAARNRLLDSGHTATQVRALMAQEIRQVRTLMANERRRYQQTPSKPETPISYSGFLWPPAVAKDVSLLAHIKTAVRLKPEKGLAFLTDQKHAEKIKKGERYRQHQSRIAKHPRGKIEESGLTINQIIGRLARRQGESAKELWNAFYGELDDLGLNPQENSQTGAIEFNFKERRESRTFGTFKKTVSHYRTGKKKLP